jgi:hypothetical protein
MAGAEGVPRQSHDAEGVQAWGGGGAVDPREGDRLLLVVLGEASCFLYAGIIFGWSPLLAIYRAEGYYADQCAPGACRPADLHLPRSSAVHPPPSPRNARRRRGRALTRWGGRRPGAAWCTAQQEALASVYTWGSVAANACAILVGCFLDGAGHRPLLLAGSALTTVGLWLMLCVGSPVMPAWVGVGALSWGAVLLPCGSMCFFQHAFTLSDLIPAKRVPPPPPLPLLAEARSPPSRGLDCGGIGLAMPRGVHSRRCLVPGSGGGHAAVARHAHHTSRMVRPSPHARPV